MNREDIIRMALEVDFRRDNKGLYSPPISDITPLLERFAVLVAAAERAETERLMAGQALIREIDARHQARIDERECCAKICEQLAADVGDGDWKGALVDCAAAIRARGDEQ